MGKIKDLTNKTFDSGITALEFVEIKNHAAYWKCKCHCGNEFIVRGADLSNGHTKSCGCIGKKKIQQLGKKSDHKIKNLIGQKFGLLTVIEQTDKRSSDRYVIWKCRCDCGNEIELSSHALKQGQISCGCQKWKSKGELKIAELLLSANIPFETQKTFESCRFKDTNALAFFDFFVDSKYLIEFDGIQHFNSKFGWNNEENFRKIQERDKFKDLYCKENNIPLIRIPYTILSLLKIDDLKLDTTKYLI